MRYTWFEFERLKKPPADVRCFLLTGPEDYFKPQAIELIYKDSAKGSAVEREPVDAKPLKAEVLLQRGQTLSLFSAGRFLIVPHAHEIRPAEQRALAKSLAGLSQSTCVVFVTPEMTRRGETAQVERPLASAIEKVGCVIEFAALKPADAQAWVRSQAAKSGKKIQPAAVSKLVERVGPSLVRLGSELEKLMLYAADRDSITTADIEALVARTAVEKVFALTDAVAERRPKESLAMLGRLLEDREPPERIVGLLHRQFRLIWQAKLLEEHGWKPGEDVPKEAQALLPETGGSEIAGRARSWLARKYADQAARLNWPQIEEALQKLHAWDLTSKGIEGNVRDGRLALELLILELCRGAAR